MSEASRERPTEAPAEQGAITETVGEERPVEAMIEQGAVAEAAPLAIVPSNQLQTPSNIASSSSAVPDVAVVTEEDTPFGPFTGLHAVVIQLLLD